MTQFKAWLRAHGALLAILAVGAVLRLALLRFVSPNAYIVPDEMLYANLARAIHLGQPLNVHGQLVSFHAVLYPLLISPVFALPSAANRLLVLQVINTLLMASAAIPAYLLAKRMGCRPPATLTVAALTLLLPDFVLAGRIMTEALVFPLVLWALLAGARLLEKGTPARVAVAVLACLALYAAKEGGLAMTVALVAVLLWKAAVERDRKGALSALAVGAGFAALYLVCGLVLRGLLNPALPTLYDTQYAGLSLQHLLQTAGGLLLYTLFVPVGFGVLPLLLPLTQADRYRDQRRWLLRLAAVALVCYVVGVCYLIFCDELYDGLNHSRIHLRYLAPLLPFFLGALFSRDMQGARLRGTTVVALAGLAGLLASFGLGTYTSGTAYPVDAALLSFLDLSNNLVNVRLLASAALLAGGMIAAYYLSRKGWNRSMGRVFVAALVLQLVVSNVAAYQNNRYLPDPNLNADGRQAASWTAGKQALLVSDVANGWFDNQLNAIDLALEQPQPVVCLEDYCPQVGQESLAIPAYWVAGTGNEGVQPQTILLNNRALYRLMLDEACTTRVTDNAYFVEVTPPEDGKWLHSALAGLKDSVQVCDKSALYLFDEATLSNAQLRVYLTVSTASGGSLTLTCGAQSGSYDLPAGETTVYLDLSLPRDGQPLRIDLRAKGEVKVNTYAWEALP